MTSGEKGEPTMTATEIPTTDCIPENEPKVTISRPLVNAAQAIEIYNEYQQLKQAVAGPEDFVTFYDSKRRPMEAPTKKWRVKLCKFYGVSCEVISESVEHMPDGSYVVKATARAEAPNGQYMFGDGSCWSETKKNSFGKNSDIFHNTRSHAVTRAKNRAVLELVGFGEVSAEEISGGAMPDDIPEQQNTPQTRPQAVRQEQKDVNPQTAPRERQTRPQAGPGAMTDPQRRFLFTLLNKFGKTAEEKTAALASRYGVDDVEALDKQAASALIERVKNDITQIAG